MAPVAPQRSTPEAEGIDPSAIQAFLTANASQEMHSFVLLRHGRVVAEHSWAPWQPTEPQLVYSLSKTFTSAAVGLCVAEGRFGYDDLVVDLLPHLVAQTSEKTRRIRVRDCLAMASGHEHDLLDFASRGALDERQVTRMLATEPTGEPGVTFCYNQLPVYTLSVLVQHATGEDLLDYLRPRLFDHIATGPVAWLRDGQGRSQGFSGIQVTVGTLVNFYQLLLDGGVREGRRLLPTEWVERHCQLQTVNGDDPDSDWSQGYGWLVWLERHGYRGDGAFGQYGVVLPEQDAVVVITGCVVDMQVTLDNLWRHLLPGIDAVPGGPADDARAEGEPPAGTAEPVRHELPPQAEPHAARPDQGPLPIGFRHVRDGDQHLLEWTERDGQVLRCAVGLGEWATSELHWPQGRLLVGASGCLVRDEHGAEELHATVCAINTPHTLLVTTGDAGWARWRLAPLGIIRSLRDLAVPA